MPEFKRISTGRHEVTVDGGLYTLVKRGVQFGLRKWTMTEPSGETHSLTTIKAANEVLEFSLLMKHYLKACGAIFDANLMHWNLETLYGPLRISVYDTWVPTRFEDVKKAKVRFSHYDMNQHSGKWNTHWHTTENPKARFAEITARIDSVLCAKVA